MQLQFHHSQERRLALVTSIAVMAFSMSLFARSSAAGVNHVIHLSVDGLRGDYIRSRINDSPLLYPNFKRFVDEGATTFNARTDAFYTNTLPNHTSMITGRPVSQPAGAPNTTHHGYLRNDDPAPHHTLHNTGNQNLDYIASTFDVAHDAGLSTALYASKSKFVIFEQSYTDATGAEDVTGADNGRDKIDSYVEMSTGSPTNASNMHAQFLTDMAANEFNYTFLHYRDPDSAGHALGWGSAAWDASVQAVDGYLGDLFNLIETDPGLAGETVIILTADHGGSGTGHSGPSLATNFTIPVLTWGAGVLPGADLYALNRTVRMDPGVTSPDYNAPGQPIRNGDTGNLALGLLGLGSVPGSTINAPQDLQVVPEPGSFAVAIFLVVFVGARYNRKWRASIARTIERTVIVA